MPTYSEDILTTVLAAYCNGEYTSIRKYTYVFNLSCSMLTNRLLNRTLYIKSYELQQILLTAEQKALLKAIIRLSKSGCSITLSLIRDLAKEIRLFCFCLSLTPTSYSPISKQ
jgi:hypothetical protein